MLMTGGREDEEEAGRLSDKEEGAGKDKVGSLLVSELLAASCSVL